MPSCVWGEGDMFSSPEFMRKQTMQPHSLHQFYMKDAVSTTFLATLARVACGASCFCHPLTRDTFDAM